MSKEVKNYQAYDLTSPDQIPDLHGLKSSNVDYVSEYWSPELEGESKRVFFESVQDSFFPDKETGEEINLKCVFMVEQTKDGKLRRIRNGSWKLRTAFEQHQVQPGTPFEITYLGKVQTSANRFSDDWEVKPLYQPESNEVFAES